MIEIKNLTFGYKKNKKLFDKLNVQLKPGNIYGLLGKNGAGKTTLLKLLTGMLFPQSGECLMYGVDSKERSVKILQNIYVIPEEYSLPQISIDKYVKVNAPFYPKFNIDQFVSYVEEFDLDRKQKLNTMSYGQKKKFLMAFGLATNAIFMVMDEPTNGLDIPSKSQFRKIMASTINDERCYIISTHQVRDLENLIDPVVVIDKGKIVFEQTIEEISGKLTFGSVENVSKENVLYAEGLSGREKGVVINEKGQSSNIDLELLFNAIVLEGARINNLFKG